MHGKGEERYGWIDCSLCKITISYFRLASLLSGRRREGWLHWIQIQLGLSLACLSFSQWTEMMLDSRLRVEKEVGVREGGRVCMCWQDLRHITVERYEMIGLALWLAS